MSNIKIGGRVYRDIEKMDLNGLHEVRMAAVKRMQAIAKKGKGLGANHASMSLIQQLDVEFKQIEARLKIIDALAKPLAKKETVEKLAENAAQVAALTAQMTG